MEPTPITDAKARLAAEVDRRADLLVDVSHQIHAHPELYFEERFAHDLLTGVLEDDGLDVDPVGPWASTRRSRRGPAPTGPTVAVAVRVRRPARHRPRLRPQRHRRRRPRRRAGRRGAGRRAGRAGRRRGQPGRGGRRRQGAAHRRRRVRRRRRGDDGPPGRRRPAEHGRRSRCTRSHVTYTGEAAHAAAAPAQGSQRPRRRGARLRERRRAAPAHRVGRAHPRHHHRGRRQAQHRPAHTPQPSGWCGRPPSPASRS